MQKDRTAAVSMAPHPDDFVYQDTHQADEALRRVVADQAHQAGQTRDEIAQDMVDEIVASIRKQFGFLEDAEGGPLLRISFANVETGEHKQTVLVAAPTAKPNARHLTVVGGAR